MTRRLARISPLRFLHFFVLSAALTFGAGVARSQEVTSNSLAAQLQRQLLGGQGVSMKFHLANEGTIKVSVDLKDNRVRLESPSTLIVSNGTTIWNVAKSAGRVTIDNVAPSSAFKDPSALFHFADNYQSHIVSHTGNVYTVQFTPNGRVQSLLTSAGNAQSLTLTLKPTSRGIRILKAQATSSHGTSTTGALSLAPLRTIHPSDFAYTPAANMRVIDLRE